MRRRNGLILVVALVMGLGAALLARSWLEHHGSAAGTAQVATIVVATKPLAFGAPLLGTDVTEIPWMAGMLPDGVFGSKDLLLTGAPRFVVSPIARNEPILRSKITEPGQRASLSSLLEDGYRAVTVRVDDVRGVAGFIRPGDFVDIVVIAEDAGARRENYSDVLLQHVRVLAVDQLFTDGLDKPTIAKAVTLEVTPEQAQKILLASNIGKLSLMLRRLAETTSDPTQRVTEKDLGQAPSRYQPSPPAPPAPAPVVAKPVPPTTAKVTIVRNLKGEEYSVVRVPR